MLDVPDEEYEKIKEVVAKVQMLGGPEKAKELCDDDRGILTKRLADTRHHIHTAEHAHPLGVLHDTRNILNNIAEEVSLFYCIPKMHYSPIYQLEHLNARTGTETFMF